MSVVVVDLGDGLGNGQKSVNGQKLFFCQKQLFAQKNSVSSGFRTFRVQVSGRNQDNLVGSDNKPTYITAFLL